MTFANNKPSGIRNKINKSNFMLMLLQPYRVADLPTLTNQPPTSAFASAASAVLK